MPIDIFMRTKNDVKATIMSGVRGGRSTQDITYVNINADDYLDFKTPAREMYKEKKGWCNLKYRAQNEIIIADPQI